MAIGQAQDAKTTLKGWIRPKEPAMTVAAGATAHVDFSLDVPADASPGGHWGALVLASDATVGEQGPAEQTAIALIILANVKGENRNQVSIKTFSTSSVVEGPPVWFVARLKNKGTQHERPHAVLKIRNMLGRVVASGVLSDEHVLPGAVRRVERKIGSGFWLGRYTARLAATYADGAKSVSAETAFWVMPWKLIAPVAFGLLIAGFVLTMIARRRTRRSDYGTRV